jgi:hypothetical protein
MATERNVDMTIPEDHVYTYRINSYALTTVALEALHQGFGGASPSYPDLNGCELGTQYIISRWR